MVIESAEPKEFFVWIDPDDSMVQNNIGMVGGIGQPEPSPEDSAPEHLMFVHNPNHRQGFVSRFHTGVLRNYMVEYDMERFRYERFRSYPSRLHAMYLFENRVEASNYYAKHPQHVGRRVLKRGVSVGAYKYSVHDSAWIDFLRLAHMIDDNDINFCWHGYWSGDRVVNHNFQSMGKPWTAPPIMEVLFYGRINFPNKSVNVFD